jgi:hypothetical protein
MKMNKTYSGDQNKHDAAKGFLSDCVDSFEEVKIDTPNGMAMSKGEVMDGWFGGPYENTQGEMHVYPNTKGPKIGGNRRGE